MHEISICSSPGRCERSMHHERNSNLRAVVDPYDVVVASVMEQSRSPARIVNLRELDIHGYRVEEWRARTISVMTARQPSTVVVCLDITSSSTLHTSVRTTGIYHSTTRHCSQRDADIAIVFL